MKSVINGCPRYMAINCGRPPSAGAPCMLAAPSVLKFADSKMPSRYNTHPLLRRRRPQTLLLLIALELEHRLSCVAAAVAAAALVLRKGRIDCPWNQPMRSTGSGRSAYVITRRRKFKPSLVRLLLACFSLALLQQQQQRLREAAQKHH